MWQMNPGALQATLEQLEHAARDHARWRDDLVRTIVCRLPCGPQDLAADAHRRCRFGRWYYEQAPAELRDDPVFQTMEAEHRRAHAAAQLLLRDVARGVPIVPDDYDALVTANASLRIELGSLRHEIQAALRSCDVLTGAYGRTSLLPELREWRELARRDVQPCCIAFMDLDHLKEINDRYGHAVGDQVLAGAVHYVIGHLRPYDKVFRYGGDEFLITLPSTDLATGLHLVGRIRAQFGQTPFVVAADGEAVHATASFGVALLEPDLCVEESVDRADKALLLAKTCGRDRVMGWEPSITTGTVLNWSADADPSAP
jgi:diguanylate cyclase (GGDEF)-like protein